MSKMEDQVRIQRKSREAFVGGGVLERAILPCGSEGGIRMAWRNTSLVACGSCSNSPSTRPTGVRLRQNSLDFGALLIRRSQVLDAAVPGARVKGTEVPWGVTSC